MPRGVIEKQIVAADVATINTAGAADLPGGACAGMLYRTTDTDEFYFGGENGTLIGPIALNVPRFYGDFPDDTVAGQNGVPLGAIYFLTPQNAYRVPGGLPKKRTEQ